MKHISLLFICLTLVIALTGCNNKNASANNEKEEKDLKEEKDETEIKKPNLTLIGHASVKIVTKKGTVIYIDPYYKCDYSEPADIILVTHGHDDHNNTSLVTTKNTTKTITHSEALVNKVYKTFEIDDVKIEAVPAYNSNHSSNSCVGYILSFDDISLYHAGDTSKIDEMNELKDRKLTYALLPIDGIYNMGPEEATKSAELIGATYNIPIHTSTQQNPYNAEKAAKFTPKGQLLVPYGNTINLKK